MKKLLMALCVLALSFTLSGTAGAEYLSFDDLEGSLKPIPDGYSGYHWSNLTSLDAMDGKYAKSGYSVGLVSPNNVVYNTLSKDATVSADAPFIFSGAYFTGAWNDGLHISVTGFLAGKLVGSDDFVASAYAPKWFAPSWSSSVDKLTFRSYGGIDVVGYKGSGNQFAMDNFNVSSVRPVPLLPSILLFAPGLFGIAVIRRRRAGR